MGQRGGAFSYPLPYGFALRLGFKDYASVPNNVSVLRNATFGEAHDDGRETLIPGIRSHDGAYTERTVNFTGISAKVSTAEAEFSNCITPVCFYSLFAELKEDQAEKILRHFYDEKDFCGEYILLSVAKNHPSCVEQDYWRGSIWPPMNSLVYRALKKQG